MTYAPKKETKTRSTLKIITREELHRSFGGYIYQSDFNNDYAGKNRMTSPTASRIVSDSNFDNACRKNIINRLRKEDVNDKR